MNDFFRDKQGRPFLALGLQAHNSSTGTEMIEKAIRAVKLYGGNVLEAPVYWYAVEPEKDRYDLSLVKGLIDQTRQAGLKLVILWFGASKNSHPNYAPDYVKLHPETYRIAQGPGKVPVASLSPHCRATLERDKAAYVRVMEFLHEYDPEGTVIAIQIENEFGYANTDRDYSDLAQADFDKGVPALIADIELEDMGEHDGGPGWYGRFGRHGHEAFSAYYHALYIDEMAAAGKKVHPIPTILNMFIGETGIEEPGYSYNAGAGVGRVIDIWKRVAPSLDLMCPDIYLPAKRCYTRIAARYDRPDNALFIPETSPMGEAFAMNAMLAFADYGCIGLCGFGAESTLDDDGELLPDARTMAYTMRAIRALEPLLIRYRKTGRVHAFVQDEFSTDQYLRLEKYHVLASFSRGNPRYHGRGSRVNLRTEKNRHLTEERGRGLFIEAGEDEFFLAGTGVAVDIIRRPDPADPNRFAHLNSRQSTQLNFLSVEEGHFDEDGRWVVDYIRNGDESNFMLYVHAGQAVRIRMNPNMGMEL